MSEDPIRDVRPELGGGSNPGQGGLIRVGRGLGGVGAPSQRHMRIYRAGFGHLFPNSVSNPFRFLKLCNRFTPPANNFANNYVARYDTCTFRCAGVFTAIWQYGSLRLIFYFAFVTHLFGCFRRVCVDDARYHDTSLSRFSPFSTCNSYLLVSR